jgi:hypothetical protein
VIADHKAGGLLLDGPRRREAALAHRSPQQYLNGNTERIVTKKNPKLGTRLGLFAGYHVNVRSSKLSGQR